MRRFFLILFLFGHAALLPASAQSMDEAPLATTTTPPVPANTDKVIDLDTVVVTGSQPGPGLWKVSKGDHTLWILGTLSPLPRRMHWESAAVQKVIAGSQEILESPGVKVSTNQGMFRTLLLLPSLFKARKNPDGKSLEELLPAAQYARWQVLKKRYIGRDRGVEKWRPVFAALELYDKAIKGSGMTHSGIVGPAIDAAIKQGKPKITSTVVTIKLDSPKAEIKAFSGETLNDQDCFNRTLDRIDGDLGTMILRANAWAVGDVDTLRTLPYRNQFTACSAAFAEAGIVRKLGYDDLDKRMERTWIAAAEVALAKNTSTFATLPISQLLQPEGYLAKLQAKGYVVEAP
ncbi:MAG: TraB/GumN family protein [Lysobacter sp.]|nr:TraB/GumN family protein [Lysobacter sp.]